MEKIFLELNEFKLEFEIQENQWHTSIEQSKTNLKTKQQLLLFQNDLHYFVPAQVSSEGELLHLSFEVSKRLTVFKEIKNLKRKEQLRLLANCGRFSETLGTRATIVFHPNNLVFDRNLIPFGVYRGIQHVLSPMELSEDEFLLSYQALVISTFSKEYNFNDLIHGALAKANTTAFEKAVHETTSIKQLTTLLEKYYVEEAKNNSKNYESVSVKKFRMLKTSAIVFGVGSILLLGFLIYAYFLKIPTQELYIETNAAFIRDDFNEVITDLRKHEPDELPIEMQHILATSYIKSDNFEKTQQDTILNNVSQKSDQRYLAFWIYCGRGEYEQGLEIAKLINNDQLKIYSTANYIKKLQSDSSLDSKEREQKIKELENSLKTLQEENGLLLDDENSTNE